VLAVAVAFVTCAVRPALIITSGYVLDKSDTLFKSQNIALSVECFLYGLVSPAITGVCACAILALLMRHQRQRASVVQATPGVNQHTQSVAEIRNSLAILIIGFINFFLCGCYGISFSVGVYGYNFGAIVEHVSAGTALVAGLVVLLNMLNSLTYSCNFFVYLYCSKPFRDRIVQVMKSTYCEVQTPARRS
jgi:hypothetical protein